MAERLEELKVLNQEPLEGSIAKRVGEEVLYESVPDWREECASTANTTLYWDSEMGRWLAKIEGKYLESSWDKDTGSILYLPYTSGPFTLNNSACLKLLEAYNIRKYTKKIEGVPETSPAELNSISITALDSGLCFSISYAPPHGDNSNHAVDWGHVPGKWSRSSREYGLGRSWEFIDELDEPAYEAILKGFGIEDRKKEFPLEKIISMSPSELAQAGKINPRSYTLGDKRFASEVQDEDESLST